MDVIKNYVTRTLPKYLQSLPLPSNVDGLLKLTGKQWLELVPFLAMFTLFVYIITKELGMLFKTKKHAWVNKDYCKQKDKIADMISKAEVDASIEKNDKVAYCRCWKSKTFPFCDGTHNKHNAQTGDNVGPLVIKK